MTPSDRASDPSPAAMTVFGDRLQLAQRFADLLAGPAVVQGLIGPRESARLWDRHLLNCAVVAEVLPTGARVVDVGSGAGLPGLALACLRPDLRVDLVDSLHRRTAFLMSAVAALEFDDRVRVVTGRAEARDVVEQVGMTRWVTARAVAPLDRLLRWCLPLMAPGGSLLAIKGAQAAREMAEHEARTGPGVEYSLELVHCGVGRVAEPTSVIRVLRSS